MPDLTTIPAAELAELKGRLTRLAREKAQLQLIALLMNRLSELPGLDKTVEGMLQFVMEILGGLNVTIFYRLDEAIHCLDVHGRKEVVGKIQDDLVRQVFEAREFVSRENDFRLTSLMTKEFTKATTWVMPLLVGAELVGVLRIEGLLMAGPELREEVQTFLRYASLVLKNEISGETRLRRAFDEVSRANRAEAALAEQDSTLRGIIEGTTSPIFSVDREYRYVAFNQSHASAMRALYGAEIEVGRSIFDYQTVTDDREKARANLDRALAGEHVVASSYSGEEQRTKRYFEVSHHPVRADDGSVIGAAVFANDITERKRAEMELARVNRALRMLSDSNQALIRITDEGTLLNEVCGIAVDVGSSRMAWVCFAEHDEGKTLRPVAHAGLDSEYVESAGLTWADDERGRGPGGTSVRTGQPCISRNLSTDPVFAPWRDAAIARGYKSIISLPLISEGETLGALLIYAGEEDAFDSNEVEILKELAGDLAFGITALRTRAKRDQAEEALHKREAELNESQRLAHIGSWDWDAVKDTIWWSPEYYRIYGLDSNQPASNYADHLNAYNAESVQRLDSLVKRAMETGEPYEVDLELAHPSASTRWIVARGEAKCDAEGRIWGLRGTAQNITERKRLEEEMGRLNVELESRVEERTAELTEAVKELESFSYSVSHDLRAPLRAIDGFSSLLEKQSGGSLDEEGHRLVQVVRKNAQQMGRLIDDLLRFSRSSRAELRKATIDMSGLVEQVLEEILPAAERERTEVRLAKLPAASGDGALVRIVLQNLLSNALKYSAPRERRVIEIGSRPGDDGPEYFVRDNGVGFDPRYQDKLFGVFQRLHSATEFEGTGIGLALVKRIVTRHGGRVWAEGAVDRGATFWFTLGGAGMAGDVE